MSDFTYTVFLVVASAIGALLTLFSAGVIGALIYDDYRRVDRTAEPMELPRAA